MSDVGKHVNALPGVQFTTAINRGRSSGSNVPHRLRE
jgi:hypothetical protein